MYTDRNLTIDCVSRTSLKGFLLGYRKVYIGDNQLEIKALAAEEFKSKFWLGMLSCSMTVACFDMLLSYVIYCQA